MFFSGFGEPTQGKFEESHPGSVTDTVERRIRALMLLTSVCPLKFKYAVPAYIGKTGHVRAESLVSSSARIWTVAR